MKPPPGAHADDPLAFDLGSSSLPADLEPQTTAPEHAGSEKAAAQSSYSIATGEFEAIDESDYEDDELVGTTLTDTYKVLRVLGEGGMGRVYEAQHTRIAGKRFAIKTLHPEFARRQDVRARFQREAEAAAAINHPNIVGVYDVNKLPDGRPFMVSELLEGRELGAYLDEVGRISVAQAVTIVRQVCEALQAAHERGVIHRDVKPENVFITGPADEPVIKVLDFGISRLEGQAGNTLTRTGMVMGTPSYMGPEQARGERVDHRTDLYATGAILYRALTGKLPFDKVDATATLAAVLTEEPARPRTLAPDLPASLELVIQRAMAREPDDRYQHMDELNVALAPYDVLRAPPRSPAGTRPRLGSQTSSTAVRLAREAQQARPKLVLMAMAAALGLVFGLIATLAGVIRFFRGGRSNELSGLEAAVIAVGAVCALSTPMFLLARNTIRSSWDNTAKILELYAQLRSPVMTGLSSSGMMALMALVLESAVMRNSADLAWPLWGMVVPSVGVASALAVVVAQRADPLSMIGELSTARTFAIGASAVIAFVVLGVALRGAPEVEESASTVAESAKTASKKAEPKDSGDSDSDTPAIIGWSAEAEKLLADLKRYQRQGNVAAALDTLDALAKKAPKLIKDPEVKKLILDISVRAHFAGGKHSQRMSKMMINDLGETGPDLLFELMVTRGGTAASRTAGRLLQDAKVRSKGSGGMRIAYAIRIAKKCEDKKALISRAAAEGDHRALRELQLMKMCGSGRCCMHKDESLKDAMTIIRDRIE